MSLTKLSLSNNRDDDNDDDNDDDDDKGIHITKLISRKELFY